MTDIRETFSKRMGEMIADIMGADAVKDMYEKGNLTDEQKQKPSGLLALDLGIVTEDAKNALLIAQAAERTLQTVERIAAAVEKAPDLAKSIENDIRTIEKANKPASKVRRFFSGAAKPEIAEKVKSWSALETHKEERVNQELSFRPYDYQEFRHLGLSDLTGSHFSGVALVTGGAEEAQTKTPQKDQDNVTLAQVIHFLARQEEMLTKRSITHYIAYGLSDFASGEQNIGFYHENRRDGLQEIAGHLYNMAANMLEKEGYADAAAQIRNSETIHNTGGNILGKSWEEDKTSRFGLPSEIVESIYSTQLDNDRSVSEVSGLWRGTSVSAMKEVAKLCETVEKMPKILKGAGLIDETAAQNMAENLQKSLPGKYGIEQMVKDLSRSPFGKEMPAPEQGKTRLVKVEL